MLLFFSGIVSSLSDITVKNDLGHPVCGNLRGGTWLCDYASSRLQREPGTRQLGDWLKARLDPLADVPHFLRPAYFDLTISQVHSAVLDQAYRLMGRLLSIPYTLSLFIVYFHIKYILRENNFASY